MSKTVTAGAILSHATVGPMVRQLVVEIPAIAAAAQPGQFIHLRVNDSCHPLLRRPISIAGVDAMKGTITLIYRIVGQGTALLATLEPGNLLDCMGALGTGFAMQGQKPLLIGGGMGLAPLLGLAQALCPRPVTLLMGGRNQAELFWQDLFAGVCRQVHITTDDGSVGRRGFTVDMLPEILAAKEHDMIYACGPRPMLEAVARLAAGHGVPCQVSLEDYMACGVGACLSCTCAGTDGKRRKVCTDGPVFWAGEVFGSC